MSSTAEIGNANIWQSLEAIPIFATGELPAPFLHIGGPENGKAGECSKHDAGVGYLGDEPLTQLDPVT